MTLLGTRRPRYEYNIKMFHKQCVNLSHLTGLRWLCFVPTIINLGVPKGPGDIVFVTFYLNVCILTFGYHLRTFQKFEILQF